MDLIVSVPDRCLSFYFTFKYDRVKSTCIHKMYPTFFLTYRKVMHLEKLKVTLHKKFENVFTQAHVQAGF